MIRKGIIESIGQNWKTIAIDRLANGDTEEFLPGRTDNIISLPQQARVIGKRIQVTELNQPVSQFGFCSLENIGSLAEGLASDGYAEFILSADKLLHTANEGFGIFVVFPAMVPQDQGYVLLELLSSFGKHQSV